MKFAIAALLGLAAASQTQKHNQAMLYNLMQLEDPVCPPPVQSFLLRFIGVLPHHLLLSLKMNSTTNLENSQETSMPRTGLTQWKLEVSLLKQDKLQNSPSLLKSSMISPSHSQKLETTIMLSNK